MEAGELPGPAFSRRPPEVLDHHAASGPCQAFYLQPEGGGVVQVMEEAVRENGRKFLPQPAEVLCIGLDQPDSFLQPGLFHPLAGKAQHRWAGIDCGYLPAGFQGADPDWYFRRPGSEVKAIPADTITPTTTIRARKSTELSPNT